MSIDIMSRFFFRKDLSATEIAVGLALGDCANDEGVAWPAVGTIAEKINLSERAVQNALNKLEAKLLLKRIRRRDTSSYYVFNVDNLPKMDRPTRAKERGPHLDLTGESGAGVRVNDVHPRGESGSVTGERGAPKPSYEPSGEPEIPPTPNGVDTPTGDLFVCEFPEALRKTPKPLEDIVHEEWAKLKVEHPGISQFQALSPAHRTKITARANDVVKAMGRKNQVLTPEEVWRGIFDQIRRSAFLCGRAPPGKGRTKPFKLTIDYVLRQDQFFRIWDGGYDDGDRHGAGISYDAGDGRQYGPAEAAARRALGRLHNAGDGRV